MHVGNVEAQIASISYPRLVAGAHGITRPVQLSFSASWPQYEPERRRGPRRPRRPCPSQIALPLREPKIMLTPLMGELERILIRIAQAGGEMPNNPILGQRAGGRGRSSIDRALQRLAAVKRIRIETAPGRRRVHLLGRQIATDWGEHRPGHKPFCKHARGTVPPAPVKLRTPAAQPLSASASTLPPLASLAGFLWTPPPVSVAAPATCRFPIWGDGEKPSNRYCDAPTRKAPDGHNACAWCAQHEPVVMKKARSTPR